MVGYGWHRNSLGVSRSIGVLYISNCDEQGVGIESNTMNTIAESVSFLRAPQLAELTTTFQVLEHGLAMRIG